MIQLNTLFEKQKMQQSHQLKIFSEYTKRINHLVCKEIMEVLHKKYYIREFKIWEIDSALANNLYFSILTRNKKNTTKKSQFGWVENELRLFVWTLVFYVQTKNIDIQDLTETDWNFFIELFPTKSKILFEYQSKNLMKHHNQYKKWVHEEDQLFETLVKKDNYQLRWSDLGKALFIESNCKYFRTPKQCRQRWLNHLDPSKLKKFWHQQEDLLLIQYVKNCGKKWASISKKLGSKRNQHSIKNRYKSLLTKETKLYIKQYSEEDLVNKIYQKLMQNQTKNQQSQSVPIKKRENSKDLQIIYNEQSQVVDNDFSEQFDSSYQNYQQNSKQEILANISLNNTAQQTNKKKQIASLSQIDKQTFEFTKLKSQIINEGQQCKMTNKKESEVQKRIRADLFLQQDPLEMLKSYFYKAKV